jgi:hypothetical protein
MTHLQELVALLKTISAYRFLSVDEVEEICDVVLRETASSNEYYSFYEGIRASNGIQTVRFAAPTELAKRRETRLTLAGAPDVQIYRADLEACGLGKYLHSNPDVPPEGIDSYEHAAGTVALTSLKERFLDIVIRRPA